jgi:hypothetical protein
MTLVERLRNPEWIRPGSGPHIAWLEIDRRREVMNEAADKIEALEAALLDLERRVHVWQAARTAMCTAKPVRVPSGDGWGVRYPPEVLEALALAEGDLAATKGESGCGLPKTGYAV